MQEKEQVWQILKSVTHPLRAEYDDYWRRNSPRQLRSGWQQVLIVLVPIVTVTTRVWTVL